MDKAIFVGKEGMVEEENQGSLAMTPIRETQAEKGGAKEKIAPPPTQKDRKEARIGSKQLGEYNYN